MRSELESRLVWAAIYYSSISAVTALGIYLSVSLWLWLVFLLPLIPLLAETIALPFLQGGALLPALLMRFVLAIAAYPIWVSLYRVTVEYTFANGTALIFGIICVAQLVTGLVSFLALRWLANRRIQRNTGFGQ